MHHLRYMPTSCGMSRVSRIKPWTDPRTLFGVALSRKGAESSACPHTFTGLGRVVPAGWFGVVSTPRWGAWTACRAVAG